MVGSIIKKGKKILSSQQSSILSAAAIIMFMIVASRFLGLIRQRTLANFFTPAEISLFFAAFRLPDTIFEVLVFGTFSSAFIPVFSKAVEKDKASAWKLASVVSNIGILVFIGLTLVVLFAANGFYSVIAPGYTGAQREQIVQMTKVLFAAQGFFVLSYVLTGVLESLRRFLIPALAPVFYNLGIILGIVFLNDTYGLLAPAIGVFLGAMLHFLIQLPLAVKLGYKVTTSLRLTKDVRKIGKLALPRVIEIAFNQMVKSTELYLSSFISTAAYAYYYLGNSIQLIPVGIFGTSIAKAALPTLSKQSDNLVKFRKSLWSSFSQIVFLVLPVSTILIVLRIPIVRLIYGTQIFDWESTVQTGLVVSAFAVGVVFHASVAILARAFYALHDTKTPVKISIAAIILTIILNFTFVGGFDLPVWGLALAFSLGNAFQAFVLFFTLKSKIKEEKSVYSLLTPGAKAVVASLVSGVSMFLILKIFDRSVWIKRLSFLGKIEATKHIPFERFVLDTRYTVNLAALTAIVSIAGLGVYLLMSIILGSGEVWSFFNLIKRIFVKHKVAPIPKEEQETVAPPPTDTSG